MRTFLILATLACSLPGLPAFGAPDPPGPGVEPAPGWSPEKLAAAAGMAAGLATHSYLLVDRAGAVIAAHGDLDEKLQVFSIRKSFVSALLGIYAAEGRVDLGATLAELGIDDTDGLTGAEKRATVAHLLQARSGVYHRAAYETPGMAANRPERGSHAPGEHFYYNNWDFNALHTILERAAGRSTEEAFAERLAGPLGMESFEVDDVLRVIEPVSEHPAVEFFLTGWDLARFGRLFLDGGRWGDEQIVPRDWVVASTSVVSDLGILGGYGHSWWAAHRGEHLPFVRLPDGTFSARGTGEQILLVLPYLDAVWVHRTKVTSPDQEMMHVVETGRLLAALLEAWDGELP